MTSLASSMAGPLVADLDIMATVFFYNLLDYLLSLFGGGCRGVFLRKYNYSSGAILAYGVIGS